MGISNTLSYTPIPIGTQIFIVLELLEALQNFDMSMSEAKAPVIIQ